MSQSTIAIIQARMGSKRLPNKMGKDLGGYPLIDWVIKRCIKSNRIDDFFLATSKQVENEFLVNRAEYYGIKTFLGDENDVLSRFIKISDSIIPKNIVRICADNPFISSELIDELVFFFNSNDCDYSCNHQSKKNNGYADGFGAEIFSYDTLKKIQNKCFSDSHREHVTSFIWENTKDFTIKCPSAPKKMRHPELKFDIDQESDLNKIRQLISYGIDIDTNAERIIEVFKKYK
jgi:spore coat polysaccharide biosynthesis protein SpsF